MVDSAGRSSVRRWVLPSLVVLLVLGHACELPAYPDLIEWSHAAGESHHSDDAHHAGEPSLSCEPATAMPGSGQPLVPSVLEISVVPEVTEPAPAWLVTRSLEGFVRLASRVPLFLLHASLLI